MKKLIVLAVLPLILSACSAFRTDARFDVARANSGEKEDRIAINIVVPANKPTTYRNTYTVDYLKSVTFKDGKLDSKVIDEVTYGTVIKAEATEKNGESRVVSLEIEHTCEPALKKRNYADGIWIDTPNYTTASSKQKVVIGHGEIIRITGPGYGSLCPFPRIIIHTSE